VSSILIRFPAGTREFLYPSRELTEGDHIWHDGTRYRILSIVQKDGRPHTVTVEPASDELGDLSGRRKARSSWLRPTNQFSRPYSAA
jgi:hypothetical protein